MDTHTLVRISRLCNQPGGLRKIQKAFDIAIESCRCNIESECERVTDVDGTTWWDTTRGAYFGDPQKDHDFRELVADSVTFLDQVEAIQHHIVNTSWIRFETEVRRG